ncbi:MAG TPA: flippase-like domain-containing protein [Longimicrobiales bacterium]|nr:flippase-like domain-containing protein [Longimicrobiales bacterium]
MSSTLAKGPEGPFQGTRILRGLITFLGLTVAGLAALFAFTAKGNATHVVQSLSAGFLILALGAAVLDLLIGAVRYQIFLRRIRPGTSLWLPIRADLANRFIGAVTPSQTGGGPAQVFVLHRGGIPIPDALSFLLINFLSTLVFFLMAGGFTAWIFHARFPDGAIHVLVQYGFIAFAACLAVMLAGLLRPAWIAKPMAAAANRLRGDKRPWARATARVCSAGANYVDQYRAACTRFIRDNPILPVLSFALTVVLYLNKFTLGWLVMRGLGVDGGYMTTIAVQALLHFILYVAPSPGGSGIAEITTGALMAILMPANLLLTFTLAQRFFLLYLPASAGAFVLMGELRRRRAPAPAVAQAAALSLVLLLGVGIAPAAAQSTTKDLVVQGLVEADGEAAKAIFTQAVDSARARVADAPDEAEAHYMLSVALGYLLEHHGVRTKFRMAAEVRSEAERALQLDQDHAGAHHVLGRLHAGAMRLNRLTRLVARKVLGASVLEGASWAEAESHFSAARELEPWNPRHTMELGALYLDTKRPELAREVLSDAVARVPVEAPDSLAVARARTLLADLGTQ